MKILFSMLLASFLTIANPTWLTNFDTAKKEAAESGRLILINFSGSDWCGPCIRLHKEVFESEAFEQYAAAHLVLVNADFPRLKKNQLSKEQTKQNEALADKYNPKGIFPYTLLVDANGKVLKTWEGFPNESPQKFTEEVNSFTHAK